MSNKEMKNDKQQIDSITDSDSEFEDENFQNKTKATFFSQRKHQETQRAQRPSTPNSVSSVSLFFSFVVKKCRFGSLI